MIVILAAMPGCLVPVRNDYFALEYPEARYLKESVNGPPSIAYFEFHGIWLSALLAPDSIEIGVYVPEAQVAQVAGRTLVLAKEGDGAAVARLELIPVPGDFRSVAAVNVLIGYKHDFKAEEHFGVLSGGTKVTDNPLAKNIQCYKGYHYKCKMLLARGAKGRLVFPDMMVNGVRYSGPTLPFAEKKVVGLAYFGP